MKVQDVLLVEGTSQYVVLCYGVFPKEKLDAIYDASCSGRKGGELGIYKLLNDRWPNHILLKEVTTTEKDDIPSTILSALTWMFTTGHCLAAVCMFDGAFGGYGDIFSTSVANQIYAFCFSSGQQVVNLDAELLSSEDWYSIIEQAKLRLNRDNQNQMG